MGWRFRRRLKILPGIAFNFSNIRLRITGLQVRALHHAQGRESAGLLASPGRKNKQGYALGRAMR